MDIFSTLKQMVQVYFSKLEKSGKIEQVLSRDHAVKGGIPTHNAKQDVHIVKKTHAFRAEGRIESFSCSLAKVRAVENPEVKWWEKSGGPNMHDIHSTQEFLDALSQAGDKLVIAEFYGTWCGSCRALYPKLCKMAAELPDIVFLKVNFDENKPMCKSLNIKVLPYFHFYRGAIIQSILLITATQSIQWMDWKKHRSRSPQYRIVSPLLVVIDAPRVHDLVSPLSLHKNRSQCIN